LERLQAKSKRGVYVAPSSSCDKAVIQACMMQRDKRVPHPNIRAMCDARSRPKPCSELPHRTHICQVPTRIHVVQFWQLNGSGNRRQESRGQGTVDSYHVEIAIISASCFELRLKTKRVSPCFCSALLASSLPGRAPPKSSILHCITGASLDISTSCCRSVLHLKPHSVQQSVEIIPLSQSERSGSSDTPSGSSSMCLNPLSHLFHSC
jgi:hypothetical protein